MKALDDIAAERKRQIEQEGWTAKHDDNHRDGEMSRAAACYAAHASAYQRVADHVGLDAYKAVNPRFSFDNFGWPWSHAWWKPKDPRRDLVRAAALIVAEIERLDRAALAMTRPEHLPHGCKRAGGFVDTGCCEPCDCHVTLAHPEWGGE
jgi:hypothetical protein